MRYKLLIHGNKSTLIRDFIQHTGSSFISLTTSDIWEDVDNHFDVFAPDAFLCFYEGGNDKMAQIGEMAVDERHVPLIIISDEDSVVDFERRAPTTPALKITGAGDVMQLRDQINSYIERKKAAAPVYADSTANTAAGAGSAVSDLLRSFEKLQSKKHVLVVDDDRTILKMIKSVLSDKYEVTAIAGGKMAEKFLETRAVDIILLDYEMPDESGPEVFVHIKENENTRDIPVVFLTGVSDSNKIREVLSLGPRGYLLKPIDVDRLMTTIGDILQ